MPKQISTGTSVWLAPPLACAIGIAGYEWMLRAGGTLIGYMLDSAISRFIALILAFGKVTFGQV